MDRFMQLVGTVYQKPSANSRKRRNFFSSRTELLEEVFASLPVHTYEYIGENEKYLRVR
ncbi:hypothetical protein U1Q18_051863, partial [Sarracenia purpurea var. burkii]